MASKNETAAEAIAAERDRIERAKADADGLEIECEFTDEEVVAIIDRVEAAHKREVAELERRARGANLKYLAEKARHTDTYKDARVNAQDKEIAALKQEVEKLNKKHSDELQVIAAQCIYCTQCNSLQDEVLKLRECLKEATDHICANCGKDYDGKCDACMIKNKWRKALERASAEDQQLPN